MRVNGMVAKAIPSIKGGIMRSIGPSILLSLPARVPRDDLEEKARECRASVDLDEYIAVVHCQ